VIDLGPEGGSSGGEIIGSGTREQIAAIHAHITGEYLRPLLETGVARRSGAARRSTIKSKPAPGTPSCDTSLQCERSHILGPWTQSPHRAESALDPGYISLSALSPGTKG